MDSRSILAKPDPRPVLVSVLGGGWVVLCCFALLRAGLLVGGVGLESSAPRDTRPPEIQAYDPVSVKQARAQQDERWEAMRALGQRAGVPVGIFALVGIVGGWRLMHGRPYARWMLLAAGFGFIGAAVYQSVGVTRVGLIGVEHVTLPDDARKVMWSVTALNVLLQSLLVIVGMALLRHPLVHDWMRRGSS